MPRRTENRGTETRRHSEPNSTPQERQDDFKEALDDFTRMVMIGPPFRGKTQAVNALRRIGKLSALN